VNLLLLSPDELDADGTARLRGRRLEHAREVLRVQAGDTLRVGVRDGQVGTAEVLEASAEVLALRVALAEPPPPRARVSLLLAMPRPKQLKRVIPAAASLGVDRVALVNAARVEKSYFDSKVLAPAFLDELLVQGLEQAKDTVAPRLTVHARFKPFVEDELDAWAPRAARRFVLHPTAAVPVPALPESQELVLAVGPDGGWVPFEVELLASLGFTAVTLGPRTLRSEVAVAAVLGAFQAGRSP